MARLTLRKPVEPGIVVVDKTGRAREYGGRRTKIGYRMKSHVHRVLKREAKKNGVYMQQQLDEVIDAGMKALHIKSAEKGSR